MFKIVWIIISICLSSYGYVNKNDYVEKIRKNKNITYKSLSKKILVLYTSDKTKNNMNDDWVRDEFISWNYDTNRTAIDFSKTVPDQILKITDKYAVVFYDFGFDKYGVLFDKNANVIEILLLAYRKGNNEWQLERTVTLNSPQKGIFLVKDEYRGTEWIIPQEQGEMIRLEQSLFLIDVGDDGRFHIERTSYQKLYKAEDKELNSIYKKSMKLLPKADRKVFKDVERAWVDYTTKKCNTFLRQATAPEENSLHVRSYKSECFYEETRRRLKELQSLYYYLNYYK